MQPYFLPYLGAYQHVFAVDRYLLYGNVNFRTNGWFSRNRLLEKDRGPMYFHVQMLNSSYQKTFREIEVDPGQRWRDKLLKTVEQNYNKTPYFQEVQDLISEIVNFQGISLLDFNANSMIAISRFLGIDTEIRVVQDEYIDLEGMLNAKYDIQTDPVITETRAVDKKTARVLEICTRENASTYVNPIGGQSLYSKEVFRQHGIELLFLQAREVRYPQRWKSYAPNLSILDVLMNCGRDQTREFLREYDLI